MKKLMALMVSVMMLLTMTAAVFAEGETENEVNLLVNGDFEAEGDEVGSTEITGWTNTNPENMYTLIDYNGGKAIKALNDSDAAQTGTDLPDAAIEQTVTIDTNDEWYTNFEDWTFEISADGNNQGRHPLASIVITLTYSSGETVEKEYAPADIGTGYWSWDRRSYDMTEQVRSVGKPVTAITVKFLSRWRWYYSAFDNVKLTPVYSPVPENMLTNGSFENVTEEVLDEWEFANTTQASAHITEDAEGAHNGSSYLVFTGISNELAKAKVVCEPGKTYMFEISYKSDTAYAAKVQLYDSKGKGAVYQSTRPETPSSWQTVRVMTTVSEHIEDPTVEIYIANDIASATVYYDSAKFYCIEGYDYRNMITNHDFEVDLAKNAEYENITNWQSGNGVKLVSDYVHSGKTAIASRQRNHATTGAILYANTDEEIAAGGKYTLGLWVNDNSLTEGTMPYVRILFYKVVPDGSLSGVGNSDFTYTFSPEVVNEWKYESVVFDVPAGCNYVRIDLFSGAGWTRFDDLSLRKVATCVDIKDADGKLVTQLPETSDGTYTAVAQYAGTEDAEAGKLYIAEYTKDANGDLMLEGIAMAAISADGAVNTLALEGVDNSDGSKVIKAFVWEGALTPAAQATAE